MDNVEIQEKLGEGTFGVVSAVTFKRKDGSFASGVGKQLVGGKKWTTKYGFSFAYSTATLHSCMDYTLCPRLPPSCASNGTTANSSRKLPADEVVRRRRGQTAHFEQRGFRDSVSAQPTATTSARSSYVPQRSCHGD